MASDSKRIKLSSQSDDKEPRCKHYVQRKKRFCKMTVAKGKQYCGEHDLSTVSEDKSHDGDDRIPCPLDSKHTIYRKNLKKHLKICNARPVEQPAYIVSGINEGSDNDETGEFEKVGLKEVNVDDLENLIGRIENVYKEIKDSIKEVQLDHNIMSPEIQNKAYGKETMKHLMQTSAILAYLEKSDMLQDKTMFVEFGAGKGEVSYWLAQLIGKESSSKICLIDRASHRHKKDNKIDARDSVFRMRADISDLCLDKIDNCKEFERFVGVGKHICGAATDLSLRCLSQKSSIPILGFIIALCCHHRCEWKPFIGKKFFLENGLNKKEFYLMTKMASWAICGDGFSREKRKDIEKQGVAGQIDQSTSLKLSRQRKADIGNMCKRIIDYARVHRMATKNFDCSLLYYVQKNVTLENVCIVGKYKIS